jgi:hypothetical protein
MTTLQTSTRLLLVVAMIAGLTACETVVEPELDEAQSYELSASARRAEPPANASVASQLAAVRALTARFHDAEEGKAAGWFVDLSGCVAVPGLGGMGHHFGNPTYLEDGLVDPLKPEVLLYEPRKDGSLRLVGVEYIAFAPEDGPAPMLFGEHFHWNAARQFWALHVWLWRNNPNGMFADWNPRVSCDFAAE